ncbi:hypothetical protein ACFXKG_18635 [Streptomyces sp. NPDC059255]|uniref:hypothetical protein n=1 Tax=Streptomyces sp. NPDC059255 TaxID=3346793 RepID=UPI0036D175F0
MRDGKVWVGDQIHDKATDRDGIVTDVRSGTYVLRPLYGGGKEWTAEDGGTLTVVVPLDEAPPRHSPRRARRRGN